MTTFTVIAYSLPDGGHVVEAVEAADPTSAAEAVRTVRRLPREQFEVVGVAEGHVNFRPVDHTRVQLAPYAPDVG